MMVASGMRVSLFFVLVLRMVLAACLLRNCIRTSLTFSRADSARELVWFHLVSWIKKFLLSLFVLFVSFCFRFLVESIRDEISAVCGFFYFLTPRTPILSEVFSFAKGGHFLILFLLFKPFLCLRILPLQKKSSHHFPQHEIHSCSVCRTSEIKTVISSMRWRRATSTTRCR
jgi:hypothetical protein